MNPFKVGDRVLMTNSGWHSSPYDVGKSAIVVGIEGEKVYFKGDCEFKMNSDWSWYQAFELINEPIINKVTKTFMSSIIERAKLASKSEPQKSFQKAGITDSGDNLTSEGRDVFLNWLLQKHGAEFKKEVVEVILAEEK